MSTQDEVRTFQVDAAACKNCKELIGLCRGLIADQTVNQLEAEFLLDWLERHPDAAETLPGSVLASRLAGMLQDQHLDAEEAEELASLLREFTGGKGQRIAESASPDVSFDNPMPSLEFPEELFCLTGTFVSGTRADVAARLEATGARVGDRVDGGEPCVLIVGSLVSEAWKTSGHAHKLEAAVALRHEGAPVHIVSEEHLWNELLRQGYA